MTLLSGKLKSENFTIAVPRITSSTKKLYKSKCVKVNQRYLSTRPPTLLTIHIHDYDAVYVLWVSVTQWSKSSDKHRKAKYRYSFSLKAKTCNFLFHIYLIPNLLLVSYKMSAQKIVPNYCSFFIFPDGWTTRSFTSIVAFCVLMVLIN